MFGILMKKLIFKNIKKGKALNTSYQPLVDIIEKMISKQSKDRPSLVEIGKVIKEIYTNY